MTVKPIIPKELIFLDKEFKSQEELLLFLASKAREAGYVEEPQGFFEAVQAREEEISTAIGYSIAIPHGKTDAVSYPFIAFMRLKEEMAWTRMEDEKIRLVFLIGVPKEAEGKLHLKFISQVSKKLLDDDFRAALLDLATEQAIYDKLTAIAI